MSYGYIPENRRAKDVRIDNYDKKFPEGVTNVEGALEYLMKMISGYELKVDLTPLTKVVETNELHTGLQMLLAGMLSE